MMMEDAFIVLLIVAVLIYISQSNLDIVFPPTTFHIYKCQASEDERREISRTETRKVAYNFNCLWFHSFPVPHHHHPSLPFHDPLIVQRKWNKHCCI